MPESEMVSHSSIDLPYQRLKEQEGFAFENARGLTEGLYAGVRSKRRYRFRRGMPLRRRIRVKVPSLRRFLKRKVKEVKCGISLILKRFKEAQSHFGDLFAGNYLFMQVNPTSLSCAEKSF